MKIYVAQIYPEAGVSFPFNHKFQKMLSEWLSGIVQPSAEFVDGFGKDFDLVFRMSAKQGISQPEIRGPTVFRRDKDVEFTIFLPFDKHTSIDDAVLRNAVSQLLASIETILHGLEMNTAALRDQMDEVVRTVVIAANVDV